jgi:hypothetical protein
LSLAHAASRMDGEISLRPFDVSTITPLADATSS